ncbi:C40 family peptidase [Georgenia sp. AZ-5]|uniref:C40 family peptidase n=1 Tax=Georgenia sp. AZ-5 TaxID=3367526 RepID=UPI0037541B3D
MTESTTKARHRATRRPMTNLAAGESSTLRRGLAAVAASGLMLTVAATGAGAAPADADTQALPKVDVSAAAEQAVTAMVTTPTVAVPADISWSVETVAAAEATPAPEPEPEPEPAPVVERGNQAASRAGERPQLASAPAAEPKAQAATPAPSASASAIVNYARQFVGTPYVYGGSTPSGFDCSGFTQYVFAKFGINLPRSSSAQANAGVKVSAAEAQPGDLVWWPGHIGIYTGNGNHIAARNPGTALHESPIYNANPTFIRVA